MKPALHTLAAVLALAGACHSARAGEVLVAVASNFVAPMHRIAAEFEKTTGHQARLVVGSTGKFYAQIKAGAPFQLLLAADDETPARLVREGDGVAGSPFTYAIGKLVLWSPKPGFVDDQGEVLKSGRFAHLALAEPKLAPYGLAAIETLKALGLAEALQPKVVTGESVTQAWQFVASGNAELGFVAYSQTHAEGRLIGGSYWLVPARYYRPIRQDAVVLVKGQGVAAVDALAGFLKSPAADDIIKSYGYDR